MNRPNSKRQAKGKKIERLTLGGRLRAARRALGWRQKEACKRLQITQVYLSYLENDKVTPSVGMLQKLEAVYGLEAGELFRLLPPV